MPSFTLLYFGSSSSKEPQFRLHAAGCADVEREAKRRRSHCRTELEAENMGALQRACMLDINEDFDEEEGSGYHIADVGVAPCCHKAFDHWLANGGREFRQKWGLCEK